MVEPIQVDPHDPDLDVISYAARIVRAGGLVVFPTETVYGIGLAANNLEAIKNLYRIKRRDEKKPLARLVAHPLVVEEFLPLKWRNILDRFWPGPLTLILCNEKGEKTGYRCPKQSLARMLVKEAGVPFAATSANHSGEPPAVTGGQAREVLGGQVDLILDGGACREGVASTVLDLSGERPVILRPGPIGLTELEECLGVVPVMI